MKTQTRTFNCTAPALYNAIKDMILLNANTFNEKITLESELSKVDYEYGSDEKTKVHNKVVKYVENEYIMYTAKMVKRERYNIEYKIIDNGNTSTLEYTISLVTDSKTVKVNHSIIGLLYNMKQKKKFKQMCLYLDSKITN